MAIAGIDTDAEGASPEPFIPFRRQWSLAGGFGSAHLPEGGMALFPDFVGQERLAFQPLGNGCGLFQYSGTTHVPVRIEGTVISERPFMMLRLPLAVCGDFDLTGTDAIEESPDRYGLFLHANVGDACVSTSRPEAPCDLMVPMISVDRLQSMLAGMRVPKVIENFITGRAENAVINPKMSAAMRQLCLQLKSNPYTGDLSNLYLQGKLFETLAVLFSDLGGDDATGCTIQRSDRAKVLTVCDMLSADLAHPPTIESLAREVGLSPRRLNEVFREVYGRTVFDWLVDWKLGHARDLLAEGALPVKMIAYLAGYSHVNNFTNAFTRRFGVAPARYRSSVGRMASDGGASP